MINDEWKQCNCFQDFNYLKPLSLFVPAIRKNPFLDEEDTTPDASSSRKCWATCPESPLLADQQKRDPSRRTSGTKPQFVGDIQESSCWLVDM